MSSACVYVSCDCEWDPHTPHTSTPQPVHHSPFIVILLNQKQKSKSNFKKSRKHQQAKIKSYNHQNSRNNNDKNQKRKKKSPNKKPQTPKFEECCCLFVSPEKKVQTF
eukprot:m.69165 g.69165  ORF g.69165 m.69165 type:complete len:108 (+) comp24058_c0_seq3:145-468(+)